MSSAATFAATGSTGDRRERERLSQARNESMAALVCCCYRFKKKALLLVHTSTHAKARLIKPGTMRPTMKRSLSQILYTTDMRASIKKSR
jgi:hypothetical protein